ncbi:hypothetical protein QJS10_CPA10g01085 [Acorus calamus]|uniref:VAN3-binding protein-like auxin canalisation domain-containing protein n=1 Tax=Acorus calamus TaxID=4465 RepID=A0AAV9E1M6_ACOCL|nr:hypothetical protein QJS10_CPA10g01085 [Acorus calamus]
MKTGKIESALDQLINVELGCCPLEVPKSPYQAMKFLCRSWSPSASDFFHILSSNTWMSSGTTSSSLRRHKPLQNLRANMGSMKGWLREARERKREAARLQAAQIQGALSVAQLAAAVAGFVVDGGGACGDDPKMNAAVAAAAALVATVCAEAAESVGARRGRVESAINVGSAMRGSADVVALTASTATCLRGAAMLAQRAREGESASKGLMELTLPMRIDGIVGALENPKGDGLTMINGSGFSLLKLDTSGGIVDLLFDDEKIFVVWVSTISHMLFRSHA